MSPLKRREFLFGLAGVSILAHFSCSSKKSPQTKEPEQNQESLAMLTRPHHLLDIISDYGQGVTYQPHPYGHSLHIVAPQLLADLNTKIKLVIAADAVCAGCKNLLPDGKCTDVLGQLTPSPAKQAYNDVLDARVLDCFALKPDTEMTFRDYLVIVNAHVPGIEEICTHPKENRQERLQGLVAGLVKLGVREKA
ncbi:MAG TPA: DUF1284 domain-containing protein [bacterium]|nr:DUF1284 domain-containing protein [bacterium]HPN44014.1 DUF1284 domain-containing protein [bacterium]